MKKNPFLVILVIGAIGLWIFILYKLLVPAKSMDVEVPLISNSNFEDHVEVKEITDTLFLDYRDPFIKGRSIRKKTITARKKSRKEPIVDAIEPNVQYQGMTFNKSKNIKLAWILLDNEELVVKEGNVIGKLHISKIYKDKIIIKVNGQKKTLYLQPK